MSKRKPFTAALVVSLLPCAALLLSACASAPTVEAPTETPTDMVWPAPPEPAVIRYVGDIMYLTPPEKKKKRRFQDILGGRPEEDPVRTLQRPFAVTTDHDGRVFVGDAEMGSVVVYDADGKFVGEWGKSGLGTLSAPLGLAADRAGNIYVSDTENDRIVIFNPDGQFLNAFGGKELLQNPVGISINDELGRVYVCDSKGNRVSVFGLDGASLFSIEGPFGEKEGGLYFPVSIDIDEDGNLWIMDSMHYRVLNLDADGNYLGHWGRLGDNLGEFTRPKGLALDGDGNVYVSDVAFSNIQIFDQEGKLLLFFGVAGSGPSGFSMPANLHFGGDNRLYVADQHNGRIKIFEYLGQPAVSGVD